MSICPICAAEFEQPKYYTRKTCSRSCGEELAKGTNRKLVACLQCEKEFWTANSIDKKYCSKPCYHQSRVGTTRKVRSNVEVKTKACAQCGQDFAYKYGSQTYCSRACSNAAQKIMKVCPCGQEFHLGNTSRKKFCSDECRNQYGQTKKGELQTHVCLGCGEDFERMSHYPGKKLYCSNRCAKKEQKFGWAKRAVEMEDGSVLVFRSLWELRFVAVCERFDVPWRSYDGPDLDTSMGTYRPDFIIELNGEEHIIEVKGYVTPESAIKTQEASEQIENFMLVLRERLLRLEQSGF